MHDIPLAQQRKALHIEFAQCPFGGVEPEHMAGEDRESQPGRRGTIAHCGRYRSRRRPPVA